MAIYGYLRVSTRNQNLKRQEINVLDLYPKAILFREYFTGVTNNRPIWENLKKRLCTNDVVVFDSVSRMSRNAEEGFKDYEDLFNRGVELVFLKEPLINTSIFKHSLLSAKSLRVGVSTGNDAFDIFINGNMELITELLMNIAKQQIKTCFKQSEKEVHDLHERISEGIREAKKKGSRIGLQTGTKLITKKSIECVKVLKKKMPLLDKALLMDKEVFEMLNCSSRNSYYKYKKIAKLQLIEEKSY